MINGYVHRRCRQQHWMPTRFQEHASLVGYAISYASSIIDEPTNLQAILLPLANAQLPTKAFVQVQWFRLTAAGNLAACHSAFSSSSSSSGSSGSVTYRTFGGEDLTAMSAPVLGAAAEMGMSVFTSLLRSVRHTAQCWPSAIHPKPARWLHLAKPRRDKNEILPLGLMHEPEAQFRVDLACHTAQSWPNHFIYGAPSACAQIWNRPIKYGTRKLCRKAPVLWSNFERDRTRTVSKVLLIFSLPEL